MPRRPQVAAYHAVLLSCILSFALAVALGLLTAAPVGAQPSSQTRPQSLIPSNGSVAAPAATPRIGAQKVDAVEAELVADVATALPGQPFRIGLRLLHDPHWHTYWRNPGDSGLPTRFDPTGPPGASYAEIVWPAPRRLAIGHLANYGYEGEVLLSRQVTLPSTFDGPVARFEVLAQWLVCKDVCIPGEAALALEVPVGPQARPAAVDVVARFDDNASRAPDVAGRVEAGWWQQGSHAFLVLPEGMKSDRAEFFPYFEGVVTPAAAQSLVEVTPPNAQAGSAIAPQRALRLLVSDSQPPEGAVGVLQVAGGRPVEVGFAAPRRGSCRRARALGCRGGALRAGAGSTGAARPVARRSRRKRRQHRRCGLLRGGVDRLIQLQQRCTGCRLRLHGRARHAGPGLSPAHCSAA
jgi:thiol:disulfide interchange protein DsbD